MLIVGVTIDRNFQLETLEEVNDGVKVTIKNLLNQVKAPKKLTFQEVETVVYKYVVGCDGAHSTVRHLLDIQFKVISRSTSR